MSNFKQSKFFQNANAPQVQGSERYCRVKKYGIKYVDYKETAFLMSFLNPQGKILPRRVTGTSLKYQKKVAQAIKRARQVALLPYVADNIKD